MSNDGGDDPLDGQEEQLDNDQGNDEPKDDDGNPDQVVDPDADPDDKDPDDEDSKPPDDGEPKEPVDIGVESQKVDQYELSSEICLKRDSRKYRGRLITLPSHLHI